MYCMYMYIIHLHVDIHVPSTLNRPQVYRRRKYCTSTCICTCACTSTYTCTCTCTLHVDADVAGVGHQHHIRPHVNAYMYVHLQMTERYTGYVDVHIRLHVHVVYAHVG